MKRIYIRRKNEIAGHVFKSHSSIQDDVIAILPFFGFVDKGFITKEEWAKSQERIVDKFEIYVVETEIDGRTKVARNMKPFSWKDILAMKRGDTFKPTGYKAITNFSSMEIEISNCGSMVRYKVEGAVSEWKEIHFDTNGEPYFWASWGERNYYLSEFMKY